MSISPTPKISIVPVLPIITQLEQTVISEETSSDDKEYDLSLNKLKKELKSRGLVLNGKRSCAQSNHSHEHAATGDVGYQFRELFDTGWFCGTVTEIRLGADGGKDRRVVYSNENVEDMSVDDLT